MVNQRWTIQCPKCGKAQQVEPQPGDYRCPYCGTRDFFCIDDSALLARQAPPLEPPRPASAIRGRWVLILLGLPLGGVGAYFWAR
jgi:hypothetical protein